MGDGRKGQEETFEKVPDVGQIKIMDHLAKALIKKKYGSSVLGYAYRT